MMNFKEKIINEIKRPIDGYLLIAATMYCIVTSVLYAIFPMWIMMVNYDVAASMPEIYPWLFSKGNDMLLLLAAWIFLNIIHGSYLFLRGRKKVYNEVNNEVNNE